MRDDFSRRTIETIARRVNYRCSNPDCRRQTAGPSAEPDRAVIVGEAAHITAASPDGKRYDVGLTPDQRQHPDNGIWLCAVCHTLIDNDPARYTADLLRQWKAQAEQSARIELERREPLKPPAGDRENRRALRDRRAMLQLVKNTWIKGVLEQSLHGAAMIELGMEERADAVERPWDVLVQMPGEPRRQLPRGAKIIDVLDDMDQSLLILGEPGSGKTTMLLELARDTIARAEMDPTQPIPVVFNLSSWAEKKQPIAEWLITELTVKYHIPRKVARLWVEEDELLLLLDGLDEVKAEMGNSCVQVLNAFCLEHQVPIVVCSRIAFYEARTTKLNLRGAVLLQPLTPEQIDEYLDDTGMELLAVRRTLEHDSTLQELAQVPLMLSVMTLAYRGMSIKDLGSLDSPDMRRRHLFAAYVQRMFERRRAKQPYTPEQTVYWLSWLAQKMSCQAQTMLLLEEIQPDWLPNPLCRKTRFLARLILGLCGAFVGAFAVAPVSVALAVLSTHLIVGPVGILLGSLAGGLFLGLAVNPSSLKPVEALQWSWRRALIGLFGGLLGAWASGQKNERSTNPSTWSWCRILFGVGIPVLVFLLIRLCFGTVLWALVLGTSAGLTWVLVNRQRPAEPGVLPPWSWWRAALGLLAGLAGGPALGLVVGLLAGVVVGLVFGWPVASTFGVLVGLIAWLTYALGLGIGSGRGLISIQARATTRRLPPQKATIGSIAILPLGMIAGVLAALLIWLGYSLAYKPSSGLGLGTILGPVVWLTLALLLGLATGLEPAELKARAFPNQGIRQSVRNALVFGLLAGLAGGFIAGLGTGLLFDTILHDEEVDVFIWVGLTSLLGLHTGIVAGLIMGLVSFGGGAVVLHLLSRTILWRNGYLPWRLTRFLDYAADRIFLRKVGGGYIFVHRMLQDYFASLYTPEAGKG